MTASRDEKGLWKLDAKVFFQLQWRKSDIPL